MIFRGSAASADRIAVDQERLPHLDLDLPAVDRILVALPDQDDPAGAVHVQLTGGDIDEARIFRPAGDATRVRGVRLADLQQASDIDINLVGHQARGVDQHPARLDRHPALRVDGIIDQIHLAVTFNRDDTSCLQRHGATIIREQLELAALFPGGDRNPPRLEVEMAELLSLRKRDRLAGIFPAVDPDLHPTVAAQNKIAPEGDVRPKPAVHPRAAFHRHVAPRDFHCAGQPEIPGEQTAVCQFQVSAQLEGRLGLVLHVAPVQFERRRLDAEGRRVPGAVGFQLHAAAELHRRRSGLNQARADDGHATRELQFGARIQVALPGDAHPVLGENVDAPGGLGGQPRAELDT